MQTVENPSTNGLSRRGSLSLFAGLATASAGFTAAATAAPFGNPDAELLALWARYLALMDEGAELYDEAFEPIGEQMDALEKRVRGMMAHTLDGIAVLVRFAVMQNGGDGALVARYVYGERVDEAPDGIDRMLWAALVSIERQTGIPDAHPGSDV